MREIEEKIINGQNVTKTGTQYSFQLSNPVAKVSSNQSRVMDAIMFSESAKQAAKWAPKFLFIIII